MKSLFTLLLFSVLLVFVIGDKDLQWWQSTIIYQMLIPSFKDSNNDGVGDFKGATQKLPYLRDLGIGTIWLTAFQKANVPYLDSTIMDYKSIHPQYGTMADFEDFMTQCKRLHLNVILSFVPNHSSTKHDWFKKSVKREAPYTDYYVWRPSTSADITKPNPPCNWKSALDAPAWVWNDERKEYYYRAYYDETADLNLRNSNVKREMKEILEFWMSLGVKGFVIDKVSYLFEDEKFLDEPVEKKSKPSEQHPYTLNQKENVQLLKEWRKLIDTYPSTDKTPRFLMVRAEPFDDIQQEYYGTEEEKAAHIVMNPALLKKTETAQAQLLDAAIGQALGKMFLTKSKLWINWATGESTATRVASRWDKELVDAANIILLMLPGTAVTYYGEEIGMESFEKIPSNFKTVDGYGKDRTPFQWNDRPNAGFTESEATDLWLPIHSNYYTTNMENQKTNPKSTLNNYKRVARLRGDLDLDLQALDISTFITSTNVFVMARETSKQRKYIVLINFGTNSPCVNFKQNILDIKDPYLLVHTASGNSEYNIGDNLNIDNCFLMRPKSSLLLMTSSSDRLTIFFGVFTFPILAILFNS